MSTTLINADSRSDDWSGGFARRKPNGSPEMWGEFVTPEGERVRCYRGKRNRCRFYTPEGVQYGPEQKNVAPALAWAYWLGLVDPTDPMLSAACTQEVRANYREVKR